MINKVDIPDGAIMSICSVIKNGTHILVGTSQGKIIMYHFNVKHGKLTKVFTTRYYLGPI